jgi:hypothetical protein
MENLYATTNIPQEHEPKVETRKFFNGHYNANVTISTTEHQAVKSFFLEKTNNNVSAANTLTDSLFEISQQQNLNVMELIDALRTESIDNVQISLITLINQARKKTSVLGFSNSRIANPTVLRNIIE